MATTITLDIKLDEEAGTHQDMAQVVARLAELAGLPLNQMRFQLVCADDAAETLVEEIEELIEDRPWSVGAEITTKDKRSCRRRVAAPALTPIDRAIAAAGDDPGRPGWRASLA